MKNILLLSSFCICVVIFSCTKNDTPIPIDYTYNFTEPVSNPLENLNLDCPGNQVEYSRLDQYIYSRPIFNPTNPNEIAYMRRPSGENECTDEIWTFNLKTGITRKVSSRKVCKFDWSILNWMVFINPNGEVWKIKPTGTESQKLHTSSFISLLKNNTQGNQILVDEPALTSFGTIKRVIDYDGNTIQQLGRLEFEYFYEMDWRNDKIIFPRTDEMRLYDMTQDTVFEFAINENQNFEGLNNIQFFSDHEVLFLLEKSIHKMNLNTEEKTLIKANGFNDWFANFDISLDKKTILVQKQDFIQLEECKVQVRNYLAFMDIDGSNERRILIPE